MSDSYSIQQVGGTELARHYPDRGVIPDSDYYRAFLAASETASGWRRLFAKSERFIAVLSANKEGLRMFVSLDNFAVFIPWSEIVVSGERSTPATTVRIHTAKVPNVNLEFLLDDAAADNLFSGVMAPLPKRDPPGRIYWPKPWATGVLVGFMLTTATVLAVLKLPWFVMVAVVTLLSVLLSVMWHVCRPIFEEERSANRPSKAR
jgi:hypothetical protein